MGLTVFANDNGFFHKGSSGTSMAFPDVCLSPPPPPAGPIPIPYPNNASAGDLTAGSKTVKIDGNETALEGDSNLSTSTGDEAGTQGGNVITHKTKGKAYFQMWSFDVKVDGKGAARHMDPMGQNCASPPVGGLAPCAKAAAGGALKPKKKCKRKYNNGDRHGTPTTTQKKACNGPGAKCWECKSPSPRGWKKPPKRRPPPPKPGVPMPNPPSPKTGKKRGFVADHQPPCLVIFYAGGCHSKKDQEKKAKDPKNVKPHCSKCSSKQGGIMSAFSKTLAAAHK